jgi:PPK2 family polyphosphate:nucleotide phosphotransferase
VTDREKRIARLVEKFRVEPGTKVTLPDGFDPGYKADFLKKKDGDELLRDGIRVIADYQERLAAQDTYGLLVVIQGLDAAGKDGTIQHTLSGVNPQGVSVHSFKVPSAEELDHDLWRYQQHLPERGELGIFNRSHYEEVLVVRVHPELLDTQKLPAEAKGDGVWHRRFREINDWERYLVENGIRIVKLFLNISKEEQRTRFMKRLDVPEKNWKFSLRDVQERDHWDEYQHALADMLTHASSEWAPWHVIPADHKWFARIAAAAVVANALVELDPKWPVMSDEVRAGLETAKTRLEAQAPTGAAADPYQAKHDA